MRILQQAAVMLALVPATGAFAAAHPADQDIPASGFYAWRLVRSPGTRVLSYEDNVSHAVIVSMKCDLAKGYYLTSPLLKPSLKSVMVNGPSHFDIIIDKNESEISLNKKSGLDFINSLRGEYEPFYIKIGKISYYVSANSNNEINAVNEFREECRKIFVDDG